MFPNRPEGNRGSWRLFLTPARPHACPRHKSTFRSIATGWRRRLVSTRRISSPTAPAGFRRLNTLLVSTVRIPSGASGGGVPAPGGRRRRSRVRDWDQLDGVAPPDSEQPACRAKRIDVVAGLVRQSEASEIRAGSHDVIFWAQDEEDEMLASSTPIQ
jgi:hypothetical protein